VTDLGELFDITLNGSAQRLRMKGRRRQELAFEASPRPFLPWFGCREAVASFLTSLGPGRPTGSIVYFNGSH
jgi:hypothetical protein